MTIVAYHVSLDSIERLISHLLDDGFVSPYDFVELEAREPFG